MKREARTAEPEEMCNSEKALRICWGMGSEISVLGVFPKNESVNVQRVYAAFEIFRTVYLHFQK